jgi:hypothetical protein
LGHNGGDAQEEERGMSYFTNDDAGGALRSAAIVAGLATVLTAFGGLVLYLAGSVLLGFNAPASLSALPSMPVGLLAHGPLGYMAYMALLMACGSPLVGLGVFAMVYFGRSHAD